MRSFLVPVIALVLLPAVASADTGWRVHGGWTLADVGLAAEESGVFLGLAGEMPLASGDWELHLGADYLQRSGSMLQVFSDPETGSRLGRAEVTLHCAQASVSLHRPLGSGALHWGPYAGGSVILKLNEDWTTPVGELDREYSYEELDLCVHAGMLAGLGRWVLDARYSAGMIDQLTMIGALPDKVGDTGADDPPQPGQKSSHWQVGLGYRF